MRYNCRGWEGEAEAKLPGGKETEGLEINRKKQIDATKETEKEKESEMEGPRQREKHKNTESRREWVRQKETKAGKIRETDRQAQESICRGTREDGQVRPTERDCTHPMT